MLKKKNNIIFIMSSSFITALLCFGLFFITGPAVSSKRSLVKVAYNLPIATTSYSNVKPWIFRYKSKNYKTYAVNNDDDIIISTYVDGYIIIFNLNTQECAIQTPGGNWANRTIEYEYHYELIVTNTSGRYKITNSNYSFYMSSLEELNVNVISEEFVKQMCKIIGQKTRTAWPIIFLVLMIMTTTGGSVFLVMYLKNKDKFDQLENKDELTSNNSILGKEQNE